MSRKPLNVELLKPEYFAEYISYTWHTFNTQRKGKIEEWKELRNYIFATDTNTTSNQTLPWRNKTTIPKLCQIRDNLHSNYISALFPNEEWLKWEGYSVKDSIKKKAEAITSYMNTKTRESQFRIEVSKLLYDYIDYGNSFATVYYESSYIEKPDTNERVPVYIGPRVKRISPFDIVFDPLAETFEKSFKIIRSLKSIGELQLLAESNPDNAYITNSFNRAKALRTSMSNILPEDMDKLNAIQIDGFGNYQDYMQSGMIEFLDFYGDVSDKEGNVLKGQHITIIDRMSVFNIETFRSWDGKAPIYHVGWRIRPDNLWAMGPLDNLVGMQYRIDHLENSKADAMDLAIIPPLVIQGEVEEFAWGPGEEIHIDENGAVTELARNVQWVIQADNAIDRLEMRMEQYAGAPREAMGIRSAGEKTAFEIQQLQNAAGRIFQEKITTFELLMLEPVLNQMLEISARQLDTEDVARVIDDDLAVVAFRSITKEDITAAGKLRAVGARHFATQSQMIQNITQLSNTNIWQQVSTHISSKSLAKFVEDMLNLERFKLFEPNAAVFEGQETQRLANQAQEDLMVEQSTPVQ